MIFLFICGPAMQIGLYAGEVAVAATHHRRVAVEPGLVVTAPVGVANELLLRLRDVVPDLERIVDVRVAVEDRVASW